MRVVYAIYAAVVIYFLWGSHGSTMATEIGLRITFALWCVGLLLVSLKIRGSRSVALAAFVPVMGVLLFQSINRLAFILEHGGMDCATCNASPLAFLIGWIFEAILLVTGIGLCWWLIRGARAKAVANEI